MIRHAVEADIPRLMIMGQKFADKARLQDHVGYDPKSMEVTFRAMIERPEFVLFIGESGALGGMIAPHPFNHARLIADELFWWSEGREGLALLNAFEDWVTSQGGILRMTVLEAVDPERASKILLRKGYQPLERAFVKV